VVLIFFFFFKNKFPHTFDNHFKNVSFMQSGGEDGSLVVDFFTFSSSIADHLRSASLVISHAGKHLIG
jgi:UDP-N-acetylglucosamine transferase subunit ALG13